MLAAFAQVGLAACAGKSLSRPLTLTQLANRSKRAPRSTEDGYVRKALGKRASPDGLVILAPDFVIERRSVEIGVHRIPVEQEN